MRSAAGAIAGLLLLMLVPSAGAAQRYAAPGGSGSYPVTSSLMPGPGVKPGHYKLTAYAGHLVSAAFEIAKAA